MKPLQLRFWIKQIYEVSFCVILTARIAFCWIQFGQEHDAWCMMHDHLKSLHNVQLYYRYYCHVADFWTSCTCNRITTGSYNMAVMQALKTTKWVGNARWNGVDQAALTLVGKVRLSKFSITYFVRNTCPFRWIAMWCSSMTFLCLNLL